MTNGADSPPPSDGAAANRDREGRTLPHGDQAIVSQAKLVGYLLSETHPVGRAKATYFRAAGFTEANVALLEQGLRAIARAGEVVERIASPHGVKYVVDGTLATPRAGEVRLRTIWISEPGVAYPRLVTAYPAPRR